MKDKSESKKAVKKAAPKIKKPKPNRALNPKKVLKDISAMVEVNADKLAEAVIAEGMAGQVPTVKYLFEMAHIFPPTDATTPTEREESLAETLLDALKIPKTPVVHDELQKDEEETVVPQPVKAVEESEKGEDETQEKAEVVTA